MKVIKKYDQGNPITTGGAGYIPAALPSTELLKNAANKLGEWFLKGMGFIGDVLSTGLAYGSVSPNLLEPINDETIQLRKEAAGKVFSAVSPLNYGVALATGHGLNPYAGEEEIATWEPYLLALGRGLEMYLTPKAIKAGKAGIKRGVLEVSHKKLPYTSPELTIFPVDGNINTGPGVKIVRNVKKPWKTDPSKVNNTTRFYIEGAEDKGYFELVKDFEPRLYSVHFKPTEADNPHAFSDVEKKVLFKAVADAVPAGGSLSTWGTLTRGGVHGLNRFGNLGFTQTGTRPVHMKSGEPIEIPIFTKNSKVSLEIVNLPGFQLKGFMRGNPLELQLSNNGTIAVNNILNYISRRSKMEQDVVRQVLNSDLFKGKSKINYNDFRRAVLLSLIKVLVTQSSFFPRIHKPLIDQFLLAFGDVDEILRSRPYYNLGTFLTTHPLLDYSIDTQFIDNAAPITRSKAFASTIEEARLKNVELTLVDEIKLLQEGPLKFYTEAELFGGSMKFGGLPSEIEAAYAQMRQLLKQLKDVKERLHDILNTTGGGKYWQVKHLRLDYFTSMMKRLLYKAYLNGEKAILYRYNPEVYRRLKRLNLNMTTTDNFIVIKVPDYKGVELEFKNGGKI